MSGKCPEIERLIELALLLPGDTERGHVDDCSRCLALLAELAAFETEPELPADVNATELDAELDAFRTEHIEVAPVLPLRRWLLPAALAAAACLALVLGILDRQGLGRLPDPSELTRGESDGAIALAIATEESREGLRCFWSAQGVSGPFFLRIYATDLALLIEITTTDSSFIVEGEAMDALRAEQPPLYWEVSAQTEVGREFRSAIEPLRLPAR